ncbi:hypothetical protein LXA43DRAFT_1099669 [Ganoderma leucocontextum]|nr:hypothetical protein LXA43DRAFT_1099669 [Ganoderma leucocontextum]
MPILAAITRSKSFGARATALNGLINLHQPPPCDKPPTVSPLRLTEALFEDFPPHILSALLPRDPPHSYSFTLFLDFCDYAQLVEKLAQPTCDLYAFGKELAELTQRHDFAVNELIDDRDSVPESVYFPGWLEKFMSCAHELRRRATSESDRDLADVLDMKVLILRGDFTKARELGKKVVVRSPGLAYVYYVMTRGASTPAALRAAKEGLRCISASPFTRSQLLWVAVEMAARAGFTLQGASVDLYPRVQSLASSALADAQAFLAEVPRDHPATGNVLNWVILLTILLHQPGHMQEFESALQQAQQCSELMAHFGYTSLDPDLQLTREFICQEYGRGSQDWDHVVEGLDTEEVGKVEFRPAAPVFVVQDAQCAAEEVHRM